MSDTPAASPAAPAAPAPSAPAASPAPAAPAPAATASPAPAATAAAAAAAATPEAKAAADQAREFLKSVVADPKTLEGKSDEDIAKLAATVKARANAEGAPETYAAFAAPEGHTLDASVMTEFGAIAKELDLPQAKAQTLVSKLAPVIAKQQADGISTTLAKAEGEWLAAAKTDAEFGGADFDKNVAVARTAINTFGTDAFKQFLNDSRLGNHPEWVRFAYRVGKAVSQDGKVIVGAQPGQNKSLAEQLWPAQTQT